MNCLTIKEAKGGMNTSNNIKFFPVKEEELKKIISSSQGIEKYLSSLPLNEKLHHLFGVVGVIVVEAINLLEKQKE